MGLRSTAAGVARSDLAPLICLEYRSEMVAYRKLRCPNSSRSWSLRIRVVVLIRDSCTINGLRT